MPQSRWSVFLRAAIASALAVVLVAVMGGAARAQEPWTISPEGVGPITLGSSVDEIRDALPDAYVLGDEVPIAPDLNGHVVSVDGAVHILIPVSDSGSIDTVIVLDESYQTAQGIGPRSLVGDAEDIYGDARLQWSEDDQGRERVTFENNPSGLSFRTSEAVGPQAGIYGNDQTSTVLYDPASRLTSVWVVADEGASDETAAPVEDEEPVDEEPVDEEADPGDVAEEAEPEEEEVEEEPAAEEPEPEEEPEAEEEPAEPEPADESSNGSNGGGTLPNTGLESTTVAFAAASTLFLGLAVGRIGKRMRPWS